ncbi:hypothetical protein HOH87_04085 [bacterium]|jgi:hypothetical protein|nr:hypothetical protein [bacterium]
MTTQLKKVISMVMMGGNGVSPFGGYTNGKLPADNGARELGMGSNKKMKMTEPDIGLRADMLKKLETVLETYTKGTIFFTVPDSNKDTESCKSVKLAIKPEVLKMRDNGTVKGYVISIIDSVQDAMGQGIFVLPKDVEDDGFPIFQLGLAPNKDRLGDFLKGVDEMFSGRNFIFYI